MYYIVLYCSQGRSGAGVQFETEQGIAITEQQIAMSRKGFAVSIADHPENIDEPLLKSTDIFQRQRTCKVETSLLSQQPLHPGWRWPH